jgi:hypothetical protein
LNKLAPRNIIEVGIVAVPGFQPSSYFASHQNKMHQASKNEDPLDYYQMK